MAGSGNVKEAFDSANHGLRRVAQYLMGSPESAGAYELKLAGSLLDVAEPVLELWRTVTGAGAGAKAGSGSMAGKISEVRGIIFRAGHALPVNGEGTNIEAHLHGAANALDALINMLPLATGPGARSAAILRKESRSAHQSAVHEYGLALRMPDTAVDAERLAAHHEGRVNITRSLHRSAIDMARGVEAWTR